MKKLNPVFIWRQAEGVGQAQLAEQLGIRQPTLSNLETGRKKPGLRLAVRIAELTSGAVPVHSWVESPSEVKSEQ